MPGEQENRRVRGRTRTSGLGRGKLFRALLEGSDSHAAPARVEPQHFAAASERSAKPASRDAAVDGDRQVGAHGIAGRVDLQSDRGIERDPNPAPGGLERSSARVPARKGRIDTASGGVRFDAAPRFEDVDAAAGALGADVPAHAVEPDRSSARLRGDGAVDLAAFDSAAGRLDPDLAADAVELDSPAGGPPDDVADVVANLDPPAGRFQLRGGAQRRDPDRTARGIDVERGLRGDLHLEMDRRAARPAEEPPMSAPSGHRGGAGALVEREPKQLV